MRWLESPRNTFRRRSLGAPRRTRIRAMYTNPAFARRGVGRALLVHCEQRARLAGFIAAELVATLAGELLYRANGYEEIERFSEATSGGVGVPLVRMRKRL